MPRFGRRPSDAACSRVRSREALGVRDEGQLACADLASRCMAARPDLEDGVSRGEPRARVGILLAAPLAPGAGLFTPTFRPEPSMNSASDKGVGQDDVRDKPHKPDIPPPCPPPPGTILPRVAVRQAAQIAERVAFLAAATILTVPASPICRVARPHKPRSSSDL